jgi:hypothetical protein
MREHPDGGGTRCLRIAAAGDVHCSEDRRDEIRRSVAALNGVADLFLLAGDLTTHGEPEQGQVLADACARSSSRSTPCSAITTGTRTAAMTWWPSWRTAGSTCSTATGTCARPEGSTWGSSGSRASSAASPGSHLPDFGEPLLRQVYHETTLDVQALDHGLREVAMCPVRIVLLHYAPTGQTLEGEPPGIWGYLGTDRLAPPIAEHEPDLVLHGHRRARARSRPARACPRRDIRGHDREGAGLQRLGPRDRPRLLAIRAGDPDSGACADPLAVA